MKKTSITIAFLAAFATGGYAQKKSKSIIQETQVSMPSIHLAVYKKANVYGDASTAIMSLNYLLAEDPSKYGNYADTLAVVYQNTGNYMQCTNLVNELLKKDPEKESLLAMKAYSLKQLGASIESADLYNRLYTKTNQYGYGLELVQLQLGLQRLAECVVTANRLVAQEISSEAKISVPKLDNKSAQPIGVKAFVYYVEGLAHNLAKDTEKAKAAIQKAVELEADFALAKSALATLNSPEQPAKPGN